MDTNTDFLIKRQQLRTKWINLEDSEDKRLVMDPLIDDLTYVDPISLAILADDPALVEQHLDDLDLTNWLKMTCLYGSRRTTEYLMRQLGITSYRHEGGEIFTNMCYSFNETWVREVFETHMNSRCPLRVEPSIRRIIHTGHRYSFVPTNTV